MDSKKELKYFKAVTYNNTEYNFIITPEGDIYCTEFGLSIPASIIELKPSFVLRNAKGESIYGLADYFRTGYTPKTKGDKIFKWDIEPDVFKYLIDNRKIMFSKQMAMLYGFDEQYERHAYNAAYETRTYKSTRNDAKKRALTLAKIRHDIFGTDFCEQ